MNHIRKIIYYHFIPLIGKLFGSKNKYINVVYYHDIVHGEGHSYMRINYDLFKIHMEYIANSGFKSITFNELNTHPELEKYDKKRVLITFDDGWKSNLTMIFDLMKSLNIKYNIFLEVGKIGKDPNYLTWDDVRRMHESGIVGFGAHTFNHPNMSNPDNYDVTEEIFKANEIIQRELGLKPLDFCFPFGAFSSETLAQIIGTKQYRRIYTSDMDFSYSEGEAIVMGRNAISNNEPFGVFKKKLKGHYNIIHSILR